MAAAAAAPALEAEAIVAVVETAPPEEMTLKLFYPKLLLNDHSVLIPSHPFKPNNKFTMIGLVNRRTDMHTLLGSTAENPIELIRPYLHEFLTAAYSEYDIMI
ncbi:hypothetical protein GUJ93_ZPchr0044g38088 [Zizania palustris]|uniref:Uncharacterized protein n=1 Tax=Zizania palustris TaxID=103762 RepID=A0A8J5RSV7_ZIZPA|nr:hypothetical protein GUJ93_ZPchr0044g38088 [Zizania palustris]